MVHAGLFSVLGGSFGNLRNSMALQNCTFQLPLISRQYLLRMWMCEKSLPSHGYRGAPITWSCASNSVSKTDHRFLIFAAHHSLSCNPRLLCCKSNICNPRPQHRLPPLSPRYPLASPRDLPPTRNATARPITSMHNRVCH